MGKWMRKLIVLVLIFIAVIGVFILTNREGEQMKTYTVMGEASLPVMRLCYEDWILNELRGYRVKVDSGSVRDNLYPLGEDCLIPVRFEIVDHEVTAIGYEVRNLETKHLIEENRTEQIIRVSEGVYSAEIQLMDLLERDEEYQVIFTLQLADGTESYYYTRVSFAGNETIRGAIEFACDFSEKTFLDDPDEVLIAQLESNASADNSSFGYTDIYSSYSHVLWEGLKPKKTGETMITIHEIGRLVTSLVLEYEVAAQDETGKTEQYLVREFYCIRYVNGKYYLMTYERLAEQVFAEGEEQINEDGSLQLGIVDREELAMQIVQQGNYTTFVRGGSLWCYDAKADVLGTLFVFDPGRRSGYHSEEHEIRVVRVEESGDVEFIVYGYMGSGVHEGQTGVCYYRYLAEADALEEVFYLTSDRSGAQVCEEVGRLCYLSENGLFYLLYGDTVYAIDLEGGEYATLVTDMSGETLAVDEENGIIAWQEDGDKGSDEITIYYLNRGEKKVLTASEGEGFRLIGFINGDLLYGLIRENDKKGNYTYSRTVPMYALEIVSVAGELVGRYEKGGIYLTNVEILPDRVRFDRRSLNDGVWEDVGVDTLFSSEEKEEEEDSVLKSSVSTRQKLIYRLDLGLTENTIFRYHCPKILEKESCILAPDMTGGQQAERYYAYSYGKLQGIFDVVADAVACVDDALGVVLNEGQHMIWNRGNRASSATISMSKREPMEQPGLADYLEAYLQKLGDSADCDQDVNAGENIVGILQKYSDETVLDLEGCTLEQILYYLDQKEPVLGITDDNRPVILVGYEELYGDITVLVYSLESAGVEEYAYDQVREWFEISGNRFISVLP